MKTAAQYLRVSSEAQSDEDRYGLDLQKDACENYATNHGLQIEHTFIDVFSGQSIDRPGIQEALSKAKAGEYTDIIVYDATRIGRTRQVSATIRAEFEAADVRIHNASSGTYTDPESEDGILLESLGDAMSEIEIKKFVRRSRGGKNKSAAAGNVVIGGLVPFGYARDTTGKKLLKHPTNAKHVQWMYREFNKGKSLRWIAKQLEGKDVPTAYGSPWTPSTVTKMLRRETYAGRWYFGQTRVVKGKKTPQPRSQWIEVKIPALVAETSWNAAQKQLKVNARQSAKNAQYPYLVRGRIVCSDCGKSYRGRAKHYKRTDGGTTHHFYYKHHPKKNGCKNDNLWLVRDDVEDDVKAELIGWLTNPKKKWEVHIEEQNLTTATIKSELSSAIKKRKKLDEEFKRARKFLVQGTLSQIDFEEESRRISNLDANLKKKEIELQALLEPDKYEILGEQAYDHEFQEFLKTATVDDFSEDEWFRFIDEFNVRIDVLPMNKNGRRRFRITSTIGNKTVTVLK